MAIPADDEYTADLSVEELQQFDLVRMQPENVFSNTWAEQHDVEERIFLIRKSKHPDQPLFFHREKHIFWLLRSLDRLPKGYESFDALQGWLAFWIVHSLNILEATIPSTSSALLVSYFKSCQDQVNGGYGGGPQQSAHLASTFSVFMALCSLGTDEALRSIDVDALYQFISSMKLDNGSFRVSEGGECDVRAMYCALAVASMCGLLQGKPGEQLTAGCAQFIKSLQSFDGGLGGEPGAESHGGNTYCGVASLVILGQVDVVDTEALLDWAVMRQMGYEGGFQGRTNKLVDSCYSFWVGGLFPLLASRDGCMATASLFDANALQKYVLECAQLPNGGFRDKPGAPRDFMHTCYALSGLSIAQHFGGASHEQASVRRLHPAYNLTMDRFEKAWAFFREKKRVASERS